MTGKPFLVVRNGGNTVTNGQPLPKRRTFQPDFEIEHTRVRHDLTPLGWLLLVVCLVAFVFAAFKLFLGNP